MGPRCTFPTHGTPMVTEVATVKSRLCDVGCHLQLDANMFKALDVITGYRTSEDGRCITLLSAKNYTGSFDNQGAYLCMNAALAPQYFSF